MIWNCCANDMLPSLKFLPAESEHRSARQRHGSFQLETVPRCCRMMGHGWNTSCSMIRKNTWFKESFSYRYGVSWINQLFVLPFLKLKYQVSTNRDSEPSRIRRFFQTSSYFHPTIPPLFRWTTGVGSLRAEVLGCCDKKLTALLEGQQLMEAVGHHLP